jgi:hypothetical protein
MTLEFDRVTFITQRYLYNQTPFYIVWPNIEHGIGYTAIQLGSWRFELVWNR